MIIGFDFDNTIVCYDKAIATLAANISSLPSDLPRTKIAIRDFLRQANEEDIWTRFQGELYGPGMQYAELFPGCIQTLSDLRAAGHELVVISHRTRSPYLGEPHDLHYFARVWIEEKLSAAFTPEACFQAIEFHEKKSEKIVDIQRRDCAIFVDDLPEILCDRSFPTSTVGVLFSPSEEPTEWSGACISQWQQLEQLVAAHARR